MELNEIKKELYMQKPIADFKMVRRGIAYYTVSILTSNGEFAHLTFEIPVNDMGDADLLPTMDAKLLIRWLVF